MRIQQLNLRTQTTSKIGLVFSILILVACTESHAQKRHRYYANPLYGRQMRGALEGSGFERDWKALVSGIGPSSSSFRNVKTSNLIMGDPITDFSLDKLTKTPLIRGDFMRAHSDMRAIKVFQNFEWIKGELRMTSVSLEWPNQFGLPLPRNESVRLLITSTEATGRSLDIYAFLNPQSRVRLEFPPYAGDLLYYDMLPVLNPKRANQRINFAVLIMLFKTNQGQLNVSHARVYWHQFEGLKIETVGDSVPASQEHFRLFRNNPPPLYRNR